MLGTNGGYNEMLGGGCDRGPITSQIDSAGDDRFILIDIICTIVAYP